VAESGGPTGWLHPAGAAAQMMHLMIFAHATAESDTLKANSHHAPAISEQLRKTFFVFI
jgi:hypothetical protein